MLIRIIVITGAIMLSLNLFGQMHGYYTIGVVESDFHNIQDAFDQLQQVGVSDSVIFQIRSGQYIGSSILDKPIANISASSPVIFQSISNIQSSVIIQSDQSYTIRLKDQKNIIFRNLTFRNYRSVPDSYTIEVFSSSSISFLNCIISQNCNAPATAESKSAFHIRFLPIYSYPKGILIDSCTISGNGYGIEMDNYTDPVTIQNSNFNHLGRGSVLARWMKKIYLINNIFAGEIETNWTDATEFNNNEVFGKVDLNQGRFTGNIFHNRVSLRGSVAAQNTFFEYVSCDVNSIQDNFFYKNLSVNRINQLSFGFNTCLGTVSISYSIGSFLNANKFYKGASLGFCDNSNITNCFFYEDLNIGISPGCRVSNNNFGENAKLLFNSMHGIIQNNNFSQEIHIESATLPIISHNNYFPKGGILDSHPISISPYYESDSLLLATNPLLIGKGVMLSAVPKDFNDHQRPIPPTLGANEICIKVDSLEIPCGEKIQLTICGLPATGDFHWSPVNGLDNPNSRKPIARADTSILYHVIDSITGWKDSIQIKTFPAEDLIIKDSLKILCGQNVRLGTYEHSTASWLWIPDTGLSSDTIRNPIAQPFSSMVYHVLMTIPGCPTYQDSIIIDTDSLPLANLGIEGESPVLQFRNYSTCADSYKWIFGDGNTSTEFEPSHEYTIQGYYSVLLVANNIFGSDTTGTFIYITITSVESPEIDTTWNLHPNPASNFVIGILPKNETAIVNHLAIFDLNGRIKIEKYHPQTLEHQFVVELSELTSGLYICQALLNSGKILNQKLVVIK